MVTQLDTDAIDKLNPDPVLRRSIKRPVLDAAGEKVLRVETDEQDARYCFGAQSLTAANEWQLISADDSPFPQADPEGEPTHNVWKLRIEHHRDGPRFHRMCGPRRVAVA